MSRMMRPVVWVWVVLLAAAPLRGGVHEEVQAVLADKMMRRATVGISAVELRKGGEARSIYQLNAKTRLIPASNLKIITTAAALDGLGQDFKFRTALLQRGEDLAIVGDGDPTLGDLDLLRKVGWNVTTVFEQWAAGLKERGVTSVRNIYIDDSIFDEEFFHPNWPADQMQYRYVAQVGGLNLNANTIGVRLAFNGSGKTVTPYFTPATRYVSVRNGCVGGSRNAVMVSREQGTSTINLAGQLDQTLEAPIWVTIHDPPMYAGTVLAETLSAAGIKVTGKAQRDRTIRGQLSPGNGAGAWTLLAIHETPIETVLARANKDSINLYAESLCKRLGAASTGETGSWTNGRAAIAAYLRRIGIAAGDFALDDGCGLSRQNEVTPEAVVKVLTHVYRSKHSHFYLTTLAVAGIDGTLDDRFAGTDLRGRVFGKSGFINGVSSLSGFVRTKDDRWIAFSILINGIPDRSNWHIKQLQERIVRAIGEQ
jgi:D-alanyl-D-alanine carboxypeptidase/D-alanyl-D-alanine-endopeptidase (penicillin-binding protein 4)